MGRRALPASGVRMGSVLAYATVCRVRAAICTVPDWRRDLDFLREAIRERGMLADVARGDNFPGWWDPPASCEFEKRHACRMRCA